MPFREGRFIEEISLKSKHECQVYAHIPQDFNLDIETNGNIKGLNLGDSKFMGSEARLVTTGDDTSISARRFRAEDCHIKSVNGLIEFGSYLEAQDMKMETAGNILIGKRLGISRKAEIV